MRRYAPGWTSVTVDARHDAESWIRSLDAEGGTNIAGALTEAFAQAPAEQSLGVIVFLTDGQASTGETDPERIAASAEQGRGKFRVFSFGIGDDVNTFLLDQLTERARGTTEYIRPGENIERAVGALAAKVASPVLTDVTIAAGSGIELYDMQPGNLPDLFAGAHVERFFTSSFPRCPGIAGCFFEPAANSKTGREMGSTAGTRRASPLRSHCFRAVPARDGDAKIIPRKREFARCGGLDDHFFPPSARIRH